jgi:hypothetical protein
VKLTIIRPAFEGIRNPWCDPLPARQQNNALRICLLKPRGCIELDDILVVKGMAFGFDHLRFLCAPSFRRIEATED